jgi:hypothetical protein
MRLTAWWRAPVFGFLSAASLAGCPNNTRDSHCTPGETDPETTDCIYAGDGLGPDVVEPPCEPVTGDAPAVCPTFYDVLDVFNDPARGNCSSSTCHGSAASETTAPQDNIYLPFEDPDLFYDGLLASNGSIGSPYLVADDPSTGANEALGSWLVCNVEGTPGGGYPMPPPSGLLAASDVELVKDWLRCGAPPPASCDGLPGADACSTCGKDLCCGRVQQCLGDVDCLACVQCIQTSGSIPACAADCDAENARVSALTQCLTALCGEECPQ